MRVLRVVYQEKTFYASLVGQELHCLNQSLGIDKPFPLSDATVVPPVMPTKIVCAAINYKKLAEELDKPSPEEPDIFLKPPSAVLGTGLPIVLPDMSSHVTYDGELAVIMGKVARNVNPDQAMEYVFGYSCAGDVTARDLLERFDSYTQAKGFDTFCPVGPWIETEVEDPAALTIRTLVNGDVKQEGATADMLFSIPELISYVSTIMTLQPGDVLLTGAPGLAGEIADGDEARVEIEPVGILINPVNRPKRSRPDSPDMQ
jgi:2-keto-4-pentenoate hydratase/2-oxohepta-3-ene-1,7-dioic acid hydratase in catechol pathway